MSEVHRETILQIYDAAADAERWPDILQQIAGQVGAVGCIVFEWKDHQDSRALAVTAASSYYDISQIEKYIARFRNEEGRDQDVFEAHSLQSDQIDLIQDDVLAPTVSELRALENVATLEKLGIRHRAAGLLNKDNSNEFRFSIQLGIDRGQLTEQEQRTIRQLLPHVAKAFDLGRPATQLARAHQSLLSAMDQLTIGVCVLDAAGCMVVENEEFRRQRDDYRVFYFDGSGKLRLFKSDWETRFEVLKQDVFNHGKFGARPRKEAVAANEDVYLCIEVVPLRRSNEMGTQSFDGFIVYSSDTSKPLTCQTLPIQHAFGLSEAELSLVDAISRGLTNSQIADQRNRSVATVNSQVKSILSKTGCATRTQFVRLMMSFGADFVKKPDP